MYNLHREADSTTMDSIYASASISVVSSPSLHCRTTAIVPDPLQSVPVKAIVTRARFSISLYGTPDENFAAKLRITNNAIKRWRKLEEEKEIKTCSELKERILELDLLAESRDLSAEEIRE
ncbi:hypothetical protein L1887_07370 [Cichorium endivia]|nr:hypothetical protein L1887_07370 [Cichorium endivia]